MIKPVLPEVWLRGPVTEIPFLLQPVAHAILQAREEVEEMMNGFPNSDLWERPAGVASVGFHLQHLAGVLDRLFTYARGEALSSIQLNQLAAEGKPDNTIAVNDLVDQFNSQISIVIELLSKTNEDSLQEVRYVGRGKIPSTQLGLLFHAAEHTQRHVGQLLVTVKILKGSNYI